MTQSPAKAIDFLRSSTLILAFSALGWTNTSFSQTSPVTKVDFSISTPKEAPKATVVDRWIDPFGAPWKQQFGHFRIRFDNGCEAFSSTPQDPEYVTQAWNGECLEGMAHGRGVRSIWRHGELVSMLMGDYDKGAWSATLESYSIRHTSIVKEGANAAGQTVSAQSQSIQPKDLPSWAQAMGPSLARLTEKHQKRIEHMREVVAKIERENGGPPAAEDVRILFTNE